MPSTVTPTPTRNFIREVRNDGVYHKLIPGMTPKQRRDNASKISVILKRPGLISLPEQEAKGTHEMVPGQPHWIEDEQSNRIFAGIFLNEKMTEPWHKYMVLLQKAGADALGEGLGMNGKPSGRNQTVGISVQTGVGAIQPCATYPKNKVREREMMNVVGPTIMAQMMEKFVPKEARDVMEATYNRYASFANGNENNMFSSSLQFNVSKPSAQGLGDIKDATDLHMDKGDDPQALSAVISLSKLSENDFPGYFTQTSLQEYSILAPFCVLIFPAWLPHKPIEPAPYEERSIRYIPSMKLPVANEDMPFLRITQVSYPNLIARTKNNLRSTMFKPEAAMFYGTKMNYFETLARKHARWIRDSFEGKDEVVPVEEVVNFLQELYSFVEDGNTRLPRRQKIVAVLEAPVVNPLLVAHKKITAAVSCGGSFANGKRRGVVDWQDREGGVFGDGEQLPESFFVKPSPAALGRVVKPKVVAVVREDLEEEEEDDGWIGDDEKSDESNGGACGSMEVIRGSAQRNGEFQV